MISAVLELVKVKPNDKVDFSNETQLKLFTMIAISDYVAQKSNYFRDNDDF